MSNKQIKTEKIKNMMIVVLLITAILLLSFLAWIRIGQPAFNVSGK